MFSPTMAESKYKGAPMKKNEDLNNVIKINDKESFTEDEDKINSTETNKENNSNETATSESVAKLDAMLSQMLTPPKVNRKKKDSKQNIHAGHRDRLGKTIYKNGLEKLSKVAALEGFLFYILPRCDVNPLAHELLDRYGSFPNIVDASKNDLMRVKGINERAAIKITNFHEYMDYYCFCKAKEKKVSLKNPKEFMNFMEELMKFKNTENMFLLAVDNSGNLILMRHLDMKQVRTVGIDPMEVYDFIDSTHAAYLAIIHNHPRGSAVPSKEDHAGAKRMEEILSFAECNFVDSFIIGDDGITSEKQNGFIRLFQNEDHDLNIFDE